MLRSHDVHHVCAHVTAWWMLQRKLCASGNFCERVFAVTRSNWNHHKVNQLQYFCAAPSAQGVGWPPESLVSAPVDYPTDSAGCSMSVPSTLPLCSHTFLPLFCVAFLFPNHASPNVSSATLLNHLLLAYLFSRSCPHVYSGQQLMIIKYFFLRKCVWPQNTAIYTRQWIK